MYRSNIWTAISLLIVFFGIYLLFREFKFWQKNPTIQTEVVTVIDTIRIYDTIFFSAKPKLKVIKDTIFIEKLKPFFQTKDTIFEACIDTNLNGFKLSACYQFPINQFIFSGSYQKDTIRALETIRIIYKNQYWADRWYEYLGVFVVGGLIGYSLK